MIQGLFSSNAIRDGQNETRLVAVSAGTIYDGDGAGLTQSSGGGEVFEPTIKPQGAIIGQKLYLTGQGEEEAAGTTELVVLDLTDSQVSTYTATAVTAPTNCTLACAYRGRLVLAGNATDPQNWHMSRAGDPLDWDYGRQDPARAVAGNNVRNAELGDNVTALIPSANQYLIFGGKRSIYRMNGDVAFGGVIERVSDQTGIIGPDAWTEDPEGLIWFVGTDGFNVMAPGGSPKNLSRQRYQRYFDNLYRTDAWVMCQWDPMLHGCWIFVVPRTEQEAVSLFYDAINGGFWPVQFPKWIGPTCSTFFDGDAADDRGVIFGTRSAYVLRHSPDAITDAGATIRSRLAFGPVEAAALPEIKLTGFDVIMGETPAGYFDEEWRCRVDVQGGRDPHAALTAHERRYGRMIAAPGRVGFAGMRLTAQSIVVVASNAEPETIWSIDRLTARMQPGNRSRR